MVSGKLAQRIKYSTKKPALSVGEGYNKNTRELALLPRPSITNRIHTRFLLPPSNYYNMEAIIKAQEYLESLENEVKELRDRNHQRSSSYSDLGNGTSPRHIPPMPTPAPPMLALTASNSYASLHSAATASPADTGLRIVLKVGTSSLVNARTGIKLSMVAGIMETVADLKRAGHSVILVMSGAVGTGAHEMGIYERPTSIAMKQALSSVGQVRLMRELNSMLSTLGFHSAQILLTYGNLIERSQYINARNTIEELLNLGVVPIVNENDTVTNTEELRFGDNDRLSAIVACLIDAHALILLTDVNGVYTANPNVDPKARRIPIIANVEANRERIKTGGTSEFSTGGMDSKLQAAQIASKNGMRTLVMCSADVRKLTDDTLRSVEQGKELDFGTVFLPSATPIKGIKQWIVSLPDKGTLVLTPERCKRFMEKEKYNIVGKDVVDMEGVFSPLDSVVVVSSDAPDVVLANVLVNLSSDEIELIKGKSADEMITILGPDHGRTAVVDRQNIVIKAQYGYRVE